VDEFVPVRREAEKRANLIRTAVARKSRGEEVCKLFNGFIAAEGKLVKFLETNQSSCAIPENAIDQARANHESALKARQQVCAAAATTAPRPTGPSLSEALGARVPGPGSTATGSGTWDTLTGNPLRNPAR
jgi:hypothetical protein